jgi:hypothetical protein
MQLSPQTFTKAQINAFTQLVACYQEGVNLVLQLDILAKYGITGGVGSDQLRHAIMANWQLIGQQIAAVGEVVND